jgi:hypothetical protein
MSKDRRLGSNISDLGLGESKTAMCQYQMEFFVFPLTSFAPSLICLGLIVLVLLIKTERRKKGDFENERESEIVMSAGVPHRKKLQCYAGLLLAPAPRTWEHEY